MIYGRIIVFHENSTGLRCAFCDTDTSEKDMKQAAACGSFHIETASCTGGRSSVCSN